MHTEEDSPVQNTLSTMAGYMLSAYQSSEAVLSTAARSMKNRQKQYVRSIEKYISYEQCSE